MTHNYVLFGLRVASVRPIVSLIESKNAFDGHHDVEIIHDEIQAPDALDNWHDINGISAILRENSLFLDIKGCGIFQVIDGRKVVIQPEFGVNPRQIDLYLLGSVFGVLLHQRGLLPFHCNAVEMDGAAFLFCGASGAGKSTLAAYFLDRGLRLLSDDLCALHFSSDDQLVVFPGVPRLKIWRDALEALGRSSETLTVVPWHDDKFELPLTVGYGENQLPVAGLYQLQTNKNGRSRGIFPLKGLEAANAVTSNIYRRRFADLTGNAQHYLKTAARIVHHVPIFALNRTWGFKHFHAEGAEAIEHMRHTIRASSSRSSIGTRFVLQD